MSTPPRPYFLEDSGIGVYFVEAAGKGAIALIGHVGKVTIQGGHAFDQAVMRSLFNEGAERLGDAFLAAKQQFQTPIHSGIALIGDPALRVGGAQAQ